MWQQGSAPIYTRWEDAKKYIERINYEQFVGYTDWRLPTIEELASLIKETKINNDLYIDSVFTDRMWFWTADTKGGADSDTVLTVNFHYGTVFWLEKNQGHDIRAVRSMK